LNITLYLVSFSDEPVSRIVAAIERDLKLKVKNFRSAVVPEFRRIVVEVADADLNYVRRRIEEIVSKELGDSWYKIEVEV